jgi:hypothetical protein
MSQCHHYYETVNNNAEIAFYITLLAVLQQDPAKYFRMKKIRFTSKLENDCQIPPTPLWQRGARGDFYGEGRPRDEEDRWLVSQGRPEPDIG